MGIDRYPTSRAIVIERPYEVRFREIELTKPLEDAYIARTTFSAISTGTDMKTYKGMQHPEQCWYPLVPGTKLPALSWRWGRKRLWIWRWATGL